MGEDLFWALRGGGGSSFGVVLSFTVKIVPVPKTVTVFRVEKTTEQNTTIDVVLKWQSISPTVDPDLFIRLLLQPVTNNKKNTIHTTFIALYLGDSNKLLGLMSKSFPELGLKKEDCLEITWIQSVLYWANLDHKSKLDILLDRHSDSVSFHKRKSDLIQTPIPKLGFTAIFNKLMELGKVGLALNPFGGKMNEIPANATPYPHRAGNLYKIQYSLILDENDQKSVESNMNKGKAMYEFMASYASKNPRGVFANYRDLDVGVNSGDGYNSGKVYGEKYFKGNFERLVKVKTAVDPDNFFRNEQSIPTKKA